MKPTVIANANSGAATTAGGPHNTAASNGMNMPINHEYGTQSPYQQQQQPQQAYPAHAQFADAQYGSPNTRARMQQQPQQQQPQQHQQPQQPIPAQFQQDFGLDSDMFPRTRLGARMHDPFAGFATTRKRSGLHEPHGAATDGFSRYFDNDSDFDFPQFGSLGGRRRTPLTTSMADEHDFFNRLPSEFRQYIPEGFGQRRSGGSMPTQQQPQHSQYAQHEPHLPPQHQQHPQQQPTTAAPPGAQYYQGYVPASGGVATPAYNIAPQSPSSKKLCDAAIQTEAEPPGHYDQVDHAVTQQTDHLNQHGLRNTVDMGVKSAVENDSQGVRAHSAPPTEQQQQQQQQQQQHSMPINGKRPTPPPHDGRPHFGTQTSSQPSVGGGPAPFQKVYYAPQQQSHPQQKQQTPPPAPQTPGGSYVRTIPIFVEGRTDPIINSHKEIPNQYAGNNTGATATASARAYNPQQEQQQQYYQTQPQQHQSSPPPHQQPHHHQTTQHRPTPLNTQQQPTEANVSATTSLPPQTPHTLDSINKIQDIQRDVLELMGKVENFGGRRQDKEYAYLDEMLTRNLLKLDTIDTNGKESIRLARKEAIKCIQASINVLEAKAEENLRRSASNIAPKSASQEAIITKETGNGGNGISAEIESQPADATKVQEAIPLPPPESMQQQTQSGASQFENSSASLERTASCETNSAETK